MLAAGDAARARADPRRRPTCGRDAAEARALPGHPRRGGRRARELLAEEFRADDAFLDDVDRVIVASPTLDERLLAEVIAVARERQLKLSVVPPVRGMLGTAVQLSHVADLPFIEYYTWDTSRTTLLGKRILDLTVASVRARPALAPAARDRGRDPRLERRPRASSCSGGRESAAGPFGCSSSGRWWKARTIG